MVLDQIQQALRDSSLDGWLFFDHHRRDPLAYRILGIPDDVRPSRRWYCFIPCTGEPRRLVHRIENCALDSVPGEKRSYSSWADQQRKLHQMLFGCSRIAMQYSPQCAIPYVSLVDAGTLELVRGAGVEIVSSADLVQLFEARWTAEQYAQHVAAGQLVDKARRNAFELIGSRLRDNETIDEYEVQQFIRKHFARSGLMTDHGPIVAVNANASNPHYEPSRGNSAHINPGDLVLIDLWAKLDQPEAVYYDVTWTGFCGSSAPDQIRSVFEIVRDARKAASEFVIGAIASGKQISGFEVDDACRTHIEEKGFGEYFFHRTGHSIGTEVHGTGANMDNWECHDDRRIIPGSCFSIEPGIYLPEFGIRSEVNVYVGNGFAAVTGEQQEQLVLL